MSLLLSGCGEDPTARESAPTGRWEYAGSLPDGSRAILRVSIQDGPFLKYLGFREPDVALTEEQKKALAEELEQRWVASPEMLVRFGEDEFRGLGGATDGVLFLRFDPAAGTLESFYEDSAGVIFAPVGEWKAFYFSPAASAEP